MTQLTDVVGDLTAGKLSPLAWFRTLGHFNLHLVGRDKVFGGDAKAARCHLFNFGTKTVAGQQGVVRLHLSRANYGGQGLTFSQGLALHLVAVAALVFTPLACIGLSTDAIHGHRKRGVGLGGYGTQRHRAGCKTLNNLGGRLHLVNGNGLRGIDLEFKKPSQRHVASRLIVNDLGVLFVG